MFIDALTYPFRRNGWIMILVGAVFSVILDVLKFAPLIGILVGLFSAGYFGAFYLDIVGTTMGGRDEVPDWPSFSSFWDDIISPFIRLVGLCLFSFWPVIAIAIFADDEAPWVLPATGAAIVFGCFYFRWRCSRRRPLAACVQPCRTSFFLLSSKRCPAIFWLWVRSFWYSPVAPSLRSSPPGFPLSDGSLPPRSRSMV